MEIKTLGCTIEYSLEIGIPATTGTGSNTNLNTAKSEKQSFGHSFPKNSIVEYPLVFIFLTYFSKLGTPVGLGCRLFSAVGMST